MRLKVDQRAGHLSLPHLEINKTEKIELKHKTDEQISPVNSLQPWDQSDRQKQTKVEDKIFWRGRFWAQSETVKTWWKAIAECYYLRQQQPQTILSCARRVSFLLHVPAVSSTRVCRAFVLASHERREPLTPRNRANPLARLRRDAGIRNILTLDVHRVLHPTTQQASGVFSYAQCCSTCARTLNKQREVVIQRTRYQSYNMYVY